MTLIATDVCNMNCGHCPAAANPQSIDLDVLEGILMRARQFGFHAVYVTGGEPHCHPRFKELIDLIVDRRFFFGIASNGRNFQKYKPLLKYGVAFEQITFSLDGGREVHDRLRESGSFDAVAEAIEFFFGKTYVKTCICLNKMNIGEIEEVVRISEKLGASEVNFMSVLPGTNDNLALSDAEKTECIERINDLRNTSKIGMTVCSSLTVNDERKYCCELSPRRLFLNTNGEVIFCCDARNYHRVNGAVEKHMLPMLLFKRYRVARKLMKRRQMDIKNGNIFEGFNSCGFCHKYLPDIV